jgi:putative transcriptional regulator
MKELQKKPTVGARIIEGLREFADALRDKREIDKRFTCRVIELDLQPTDYDAEMVRQTRQLLHASQAVFARFLGVSVKTVRAWEQSANTPSDMACRFMDEIRLNPKYWMARLRKAAVDK